VTTATAPLPPETSRSLLQESLFAWLEPTSVSEPDTRPALSPELAPTPEQKTAPPLVTAPEAEAPDLSHIWVVAAEIEVTPKIASVADYRGSFKTTAGQRVDALEVYCRGCRRPYDEVRGADCAASPWPAARNPSSCPPPQEALRPRRLPQPAPRPKRSPREPRPTTSPAPEPPAHSPRTGPPPRTSPRRASSSRPKPCPPRDSRSPTPTSTPCP
jgi:hypothetical protein